jgi:hypothetical protein
MPPAGAEGRSPLGALPILKIARAFPHALFSDSRILSLQGGHNPLKSLERFRHILTSWVLKQPSILTSWVLYPDLLGADLT